MRARVPESVLALVPALMLGVVLGGCDSATPLGDGTGPAPTEGASLFEATGNVEARMTGLHDTAPVTRPKAEDDGAATDGTATLALASVTRVAPPRDTMQVGALTHAGGTVYIGYHTPGSAFGGAIDRLDASAPAHPPAEKSLHSDAVDVQGLAYDDAGEALYVTGGVRASAYDGDLRGTPAALLRVDGVQEPRTTVAGLPGGLETSVAPAPDRVPEHEVYVATEEGALHRFGAGLDDETRREVAGTALKSVAATPNAVFASDRDGGVYAGEIGADGTLAAVSGLDAERVERLRARSGPALQGERLFLALGDGGMAVLDASSGDVLFRRAAPTYTSVTLHESDPEVPNEPADLVYAARPNGRLDVYRVGDQGLDTGTPRTGLHEVGTIDLQRLSGAGIGAAAPVAQVLGVGCHVYAASSSGVVAMTLGTAQGCGTGGHRLPTASDDSSTTTEREATTTAVLENDADADGTLDPATVQIQRAPDHGTVHIDPSTGDITYAPEPGFTGTDTYTYTVSDQDGWTSNQATVTMTVEALAPPPPPGASRLQKTKIFVADEASREGRSADGASS